MEKNRLFELETKLIQLESSTSLKLGQTLIEACRRPGLPMLRLPFDLVRLMRKAKRSERSHVYQKAYQELTQRYNIDAELWFAGMEKVFRSKSRPCICGVLSPDLERLLEAFFTVENLHPNSVRIAKEVVSPDVILFDSVAFSDCGAWKSAMSGTAAALDRELLGILKWAERNGTPTVFLSHPQVSIRFEKSFAELCSWWIGGEGRTKDLASSLQSFVDLRFDNPFGLSPLPSRSEQGVFQRFRYDDIGKASFLRGVPIELALTEMREVYRNNTILEGLGALVSCLPEHSPIRKYPRFSVVYTGTEPLSDSDWEWIQRQSVMPDEVWASSSGSPNFSVKPYGKNLSHIALKEGVTWVFVLNSNSYQQFGSTFFEDMLIAQYLSRAEIVGWNEGETATYGPIRGGSGGLLNLDIFNEMFLHRIAARSSMMDEASRMGTTIFSYPRGLLL